MQNSISAAQRQVANADLPAAYERVRQVVAEAKEANLSRSRDIRGPLNELVETLETRAMSEYEEALAQYFAGDHESAVERFEALTQLEGLRAANSAQGELRKEDDRAQWRSLQVTVTQLLAQNDFAAAQRDLRQLERTARRIGYKDASDATISEFSEVAASHVEQAEQAITDERFEDAYSTLLHISRLSSLRRPAVAARQLLREHGSLPGMRLAQREYESADMLADLRQELAEAEGRVDAPATREAVQRKLTALLTTYEGTRAAEQAQELSTKLSEQLASR